MLLYDPLILLPLILIFPRGRKTDIHIKTGIQILFLVVLVVKNLGANAESLGQEDPLKKGIATHSTVMAWVSYWARS